MFYVAGWNIPGCLPEMEPASFATRGDALEFMRQEFSLLEDQAFDEIADPQYDGKYPSRAFAHLESGHEVVEYNGYHYWIEECEGEMPAEDIAA